MKEFQTNMIKNFFIVIISLILGLALIEGALRAFVPIRNVGPSFTTYDAILGKRLKSNFHTTRVTPEFTMKFTTNSLGFRGPEPAKFPRQSILFLGDSFTMGYGVNDGQEFPALVLESLRNHFRDVDISVVNAGLGDNGNGRWLKFIRSEAHMYEPRLLILALTSNDFRDNNRERLFEIAPDFKLRELPIPPKSRFRRLQEWIEIVPGLASTYLVGLSRQIMFGFQKDKHVAEGSPSETDAPREDQLTFKILEETLSLAQDKKWPVLAITTNIEGQRLEKLNKIFEHYDMPWINMPSKKAQPEFYYIHDAHWNASGHSHARELIFDWLIENEHEWLSERN